MEGMKKYPDKYFGLAIVDPPYGINYDSIAEKRSGTKAKGSATFCREYQSFGWDIAPPNDDYFAELFRISKKAIIWGGGITSNNYPHSVILFVGTKGSATI